MNPNFKLLNDAYVSCRPNCEVRKSVPAFISKPILSLLLMLAVGLCVADGLHADDTEFTEDAAAAVKQAVEQEKDLIFFFTGSDWCPPCKKLDEEVFSETEFMFEISKHYVMVKLDFPKQTEQDPAIAKQNEALAEKYGVTSFPTLVLTDDKMKPFAFASYEAGGFQNYLGLLEEARKLRLERDENLVAAKGKTGAERAKFLDLAIGKMRTEIVGVYYSDIVAEIVSLDKDNQLGLRSKWNAAEDTELRKIIMEDLMMIARVEKPARAIDFIDEVMKEIEFSDAERLNIYEIKLNIVRLLKDDALVDALLDEMIALDGVEGSTRERLIVKKIFLMVGSDRYEEAMQLLNDSIAKGEGSLHLILAKGQLLASRQKFKLAIEAFDEALATARNSPDIMIDLVSAKADAMYELKDEAGALTTLDNFSDDTQMPADLRAESLLHKAMIMRDAGRTRQAKLAENRAIEVTESATERSEMQKIVERLRDKYSN
ncbi:MAG: tetratricopeptide (TPR) repeat protein [Mariniblastus sp.]|jgi:tetratricopeptide (TPR) repeat protein